ncbi:MAG TPA: FeoA family protein [Saprospiraceae bacterium]|nr:FeoA family protein [Saprospiraceae bacterium]
MLAPIKQHKCITSLQRGQEGIVSHIGNERIAGKLMAMGILPGSMVRLIRKAPFGGGWYIKADNMTIALRREEAESIILR